MNGTDTCTFEDSNTSPVCTGVTCPAPTPPAPPPAPTPPTPPAPPAPTPQSGYRCNGLTGQCVADAGGALSAAGCIATCTVKYSCDAEKGLCAADAAGTQSLHGCQAGCACVAPNNCGLLNGTASCGGVLQGCNVCDSCCNAGIVSRQVCDACVRTPGAQQGCGGK